jgi:hypothetical protein|nr:MAG TPA: hypothetical protein [Caudoviricetes sp.]
MRDTVFEIGDNVVIKGRENEGIWIIDNETKDREGNTMFDLIAETSYGANIEEDVYPESLTSEADYLEYLHNIANPSIEFPLFKSYGLTKEQVLEVVMNFISNQIELHKNLAEEAMNDNNYEFAADYFKEVNALLQIKMMEDKFYHRFVQE